MNKVVNFVLFPLLVIIGLAIIIASFMYTKDVVVSLAEEEHAKMELCASATEHIVESSVECDISFEQSVITDNRTIPVILTDGDFNVLDYKNLGREYRVNELAVTEQDRQQIKADSVELRHLAMEFASKNKPVIINLGDGFVQYVCYGSSLLYKKLFYFPIIQFGVIVLFVLLMVIAIIFMKRSEQNKVWVGLSKETAHQLGTPISSLMAWNDLLKAKYPDDEMLIEMDKDINRLHTVADRFSQIGSSAELKRTCVNEVVDDVVHYISTRFSKKVQIRCSSNVVSYAMLNIPLFEWVIENLCKNAVDAMDGNGHIDINITENVDTIFVDVKDDGKGIAFSNKNKVFSPGFTTKKRGWGLGLSLAKRIIEEYHHGKIYVKSSHVGKGTTFRIELKRVA